MVPVMKKETRWIITGANGYLGAEISKMLSQNGNTVLAVARDRAKLNDLDNDRIHCYTYDDLACAILPGDVFVHCAGKTGSMGRWEDFYRINVQWPLELFDQAAEKKVDCFIYVSSVAALGYRNRPGKSVLDEKQESELVPGELYGRSKLLAEQELQRRSRKTNIRLIIFRPGLIYGHRWFGRNQSWLYRGTMVDPLQRVPLVHIKNFLDAIIRVAKNTAASGIFFVVDDEQPTLKDLNTKKIELGLIRYQPWRIGKTGFWIHAAIRTAIHFFRRKYHVLPKGYSWAQFFFQTRRIQYSTEKLQSFVAWRPTVNLSQGLLECVANKLKILC